MRNDRPIEDANLQAALDEVHAVMQRRNVAGACMLVSAREAAFAYKLDATWSAFRPDPTLALGVRFTANSTEEGKDETQGRVSGGLHTVCQLADFGTQTLAWMTDLQTMLRRAGLDFEHTPFGGKPLPRIDSVDAP